MYDAVDAKFFLSNPVNCSFSFDKTILQYLIVSAQVHHPVLLVGYSGKCIKIKQWENYDDVCANSNGYVVIKSGGQDND